VFDGILRQYLDMAVDRVRVLRRDPVLECLRHALLTLALAVDAHRNAHAGEESLADTALWARLSTLPWPVSAGAAFRTLADAVAAERARRGPARINTAAAKVTADRQAGSYASHRLRKALLFLENLGAIAREADEADTRIIVTNRAQLGELRRRWDDKYFGAYDFGR
jgi:hypothetical protein